MVLRGPDGSAETSVTLDGVLQQGTYVPLVDDRKEHGAEVKFRSSDVAARG